MIVFCEDCGRRYSLDFEDICASPNSFTCRGCDHVITVAREKDSHAFPSASSGSAVLDQEDNLHLKTDAPPGENPAAMGPRFVERRRFQRIFFTVETGPCVYFTFSGSTGREFSAVVINLSVDGLRMVVMDEHVPLLQHEGQEIRITRITGDPDLSFLAGEKAEVRWVLGSPDMSYRGFGCRLMGISDVSRHRLDEIIGAVLQKHRRHPLPAPMAPGKIG